MKWALMTSAALALIGVAPASEAGRGHAFGGVHGHVVVGAGGAHFAHPHFFHGGTRVFIGGAFVAWPGWYYPPPYYSAPPPAPVTYWYYCPPAGAYYPYVPACPTGWQLVPAYPGY